MLLLFSIMQVGAQKKMRSEISLKKSTSMRQHRAHRAGDNKGVTTTLRYEQIADMKTPRIGHQIFPSGNGFVVVGGHTTNFKLTTSAEIYENGSWRDLSVSVPHDGGFSVTMSDGRVMVGGGFSDARGVGQSSATDIYNPSTQKFIKGPDMTLNRAACAAINAGGKVYVNGNWYADTPVMDYYNGSSFTEVGNMDNRSNPYMMSDKEGNVLTFSSYNEKGGNFGYYTTENGDECLLADIYAAATGETRYFPMWFSSQEVPLMLPDDMRPENYHVMLEGHNCYFVLVKIPNGYQMFLVDMDDEEYGVQLYYYGPESLEIPNRDNDGQEISWRGGVLTNDAREEAYIIGTSGTAGNRTLHILSWNFNSGDWTIASAPGFMHDLQMASWTVLADGRIACTGGGVKDNFDAQSLAYIFTPPTAGKDYEETPDNPTSGGPKLVVWLKSGDKVVYELADVPVTTFSGSQLIIRTNKVTIPYERKNVLRYTYEDVVTKGIELMPGERRVEMNRDGDEITFRGLVVGGTASIYAVNGTLVEQRKVTDKQPLTLSLKNRPNGVYIVKAGTETIKVMKR